MHRIILLALLLSTIIGCNNSPTKDVQEVDSTKENKTVLQESSHSDTLTIDSKCALIYSPDRVRLEAEIQKLGRDTFQIGFDDYAYYINESSTFLESKGIHVDTTSKKWIRFQWKDGTKIIRTDTLRDLFGILLFDGQSRPMEIDITDVDKEYNAYFKVMDSANERRKK